MSDPIKHECGLALVRLKKPLAYYDERYGSPLWGMRKLYLLMEKQRNRGQDGAGVGVLKQGALKGARYHHRIREAGANCLDRIWRSIHRDLEHLHRDGVVPKDPEALKRVYPWLGEIYLGHLRYGTHGGQTIDNCHPYERISNWPTRYLTLAGNFNLTNSHEIFDMLVGLGQHPLGSADTATVMEKIGHFLDEANESIVRKLRNAVDDGDQLVERIAAELDFAQVLKKASRAWDGGYHLGGIVGHGLSFVFRDPNGIRPSYWYEDDEVIAAASERVALVTCFEVADDKVKELTPGCALIIDHHGVGRETEILPQAERRSCSFERIYFSRGNDRDIYRERKALGKELVPALLKAIDHDLEHTVISYVPNTAEVAYLGVVEGLEDWLAEWKEREILRLQEHGELTPDTLRRILQIRPWVEKAAHKDAKLRTFITDDRDRGDLVAHAYDISRGILRPGLDNLAVIDDSIVRGTTLRQSILRMLTLLSPRKIVVLSSAPQIRFPDCYGIDMSEMGKFIAFEAAIALLRDRGREALIDEVYQDCCAELLRAEAARLPNDPPSPQTNHVKRIYAEFTDIEVSAKIAELVRPQGTTWNGEIEVAYQTVEGLRWAIPGHTGDWYFTGDYPTPGGAAVANRAFVNWVEKRSGRAYEASRG